jgi:hypothetical protein
LVRITLKPIDQGIRQSPASKEILGGKKVVPEKAAVATRWYCWRWVGKRAYRRERRFIVEDRR